MEAVLRQQISLIEVGVAPQNDALTILHTGEAIRSAYSRRSQFGILSGPTDLEGLRFARIFHTRSFILPGTRGNLFPGQGE